MKINKYKENQYNNVINSINIFFNKYKVYIIADRKVNRI